MTALGLEPVVPGNSYRTLSVGTMVTLRHDTVVLHVLFEIHAVERSNRDRRRLSIL